MNDIDGANRVGDGSENQNQCIDHLKAGRIQDLHDKQGNERDFVSSFIFQYAAKSKYLLT